ncbi:transglycosylase domain-containing protein [Desertivirga arenae]|uniref:transglycosylase domain-containing protein n=1 Tax=Desertivirga arenae TaxID=2810309 RepID=UPI001A96307C|nr:biosynthetic peptidoglycan transglycosylase [Pedobacter sp. SYSU D00823]
MRRKRSKYLKIALVSFIILIVLASIGISIVYAKREAILKSVITKAINKARRDYNVDLKIDNPKFEGLASIAFDDISIVPQDRDSLLYINDLHVSVRVIPLIFGNIKVAALKIKSGKLNITKRDSIRNYDFLFNKKRDSTKTRSKADLADLAHKLLNNALDKVPEDMEVNNLDVFIQRDEDQFRFYTTKATIDNGNLKSNIIVNNGEALWHFNGIVEPDDERLEFQLFADGKKVELPVIEQKFGLKLNVDTLFMSLKEARKSGDDFKIYSYFAVKNFLLNHPKIASNDIVVPAGSIDADIIIGENFVGLDSTSVIHLNKIKANPFIKYTLKPTKTYELKLKTDKMEGQDLFESFPNGIFESLDGIKVKGQLQYEMSFFLDTKNPDSVRFNSALHKTNFAIVKWGKTNLQKINNTFVYTPYEYGKPMRDIIIGPGNPDYVPLNQISSYLRNAVLTAEDPSFFTHHGFVEKAFQRSIATNFKEKSFKRGGSTISMQLVKNVFLSRQKTMARKIEEILIVWLMENNKVSTKERMYEVYLNLIEWGQNIYGIGEAARFYFDKHPSELDLGESIFLANIVPRPKKGLYFFEGDGSLRVSLRGYFKLIGNLMARRGYVSRDTNAYGFYGVRLKSSLRRGGPSIDTTSVDSLMMDEEPPVMMDEQTEEDRGNFLSRIFGRKKKPDTAYVSSDGKIRIIRDSANLSRRERRELRRREKEQKKVEN